jgi:predicted MPP superfamily phosphohydrolase
MSAFFSVGIILTLYLAVNAYLFARLFITLAGTGAARGIACALLLFLALSFPVGRIVSDKLPRYAVSFLAVVSSLYLAPMVYGFFFTLCADFLRLINRFVYITPLPPPFSVNGRLNAVIAVVALSILVSAAGALNARFPRTIRHELEYRLTENTLRYDANSRPPLKIAVISDVHLGRLVGLRHMRKLVNLVNRENVDIVLLLGDTIDDTAWMRDEGTRSRGIEIFGEMTSRLGTWAVVGNHEYYAGLAESVAFLEDAGVRVLRDQWETPGGEMLLVGRDDRTLMRVGGVRKSIPDILADAETKPAANVRALPLIVMDHQPFALDEAEEAGAALQISGHTHRGQLFPFNFLVAMMYECHYGLYKKGSTNYYISSGAGTWGPPVRTSGRPEVVVIDLNFRE